jgi:cathepsin K
MKNCAFYNKNTVLMNILIFMLILHNCLGIKYFTNDVLKQKNMFENFKIQYNKKYTSKQEEDNSFVNFIASLKEIDEMNILSNSYGLKNPAKFSITTFSDLNSSMIFHNVDKYIQLTENNNTNIRKLQSCDSTTTQTLKDWSIGPNSITTPIKNQGWCMGGHWAHAVVEQVESDALRRSLSYSYILSPQQLLQCVTNNNGCSIDGLGVLEYAFNYLKNTGLYLNNHYPYTSYSGWTGGRCKTISSNNNDEVVKVNGFYSVLTGNEECMANHVQTTGTLAVCLTVGANIRNYHGGILTVDTCLAPAYVWFMLDNNHYITCGQIVGINLVSGTETYWKYRGSYGIGWGEAGYAKIAYGTNACNINQNPIYASVLVQGEF